MRQLEGTVKVDQAQVDNAQLQLSYTRITAPISGRLGLRQVDAGNMVRASDANGIVVITQVDPDHACSSPSRRTRCRACSRACAGRASIAVRGLGPRAEEPARHAAC